MKIIGIEGPTPKDSSYFEYCIDTGNMYHYECERYSRLKEAPDNPLARYLESGKSFSPGDRLVIGSNVTNLGHSQAYISRVLPAELRLDDNGVLTPESCSHLKSLPWYTRFCYGDDWIHPVLLHGEGLSAVLSHEIWGVSHHLCHASHGFLSSVFDSALVITVDGGGVDFLRKDVMQPSQTLGDLGWTINSFTAWEFTDSSYKKLASYSLNQVNIGVAYDAVTAYILGSRTSSIGGNQCGTVMAMASVYTPYVAIDICRRLIRMTSFSDITHVLVQTYGESPSEDIKYALSASIQLAVEEFIEEIISPFLDKYRNIVFSGGVALNSVMIGKLHERLHNSGYSFFVPPVPYDAGLTIGMVQHIGFYELALASRSRVSPLSPYLGKEYGSTDILDALKAFTKDLSVVQAELTEVAAILEQGKICAVFSGASESGRRALGNRSILADPRSKRVKDMINDRIKHRQWFRPFAPVVLEDYVSDIFKTETSSPYMSFVISLRKDCQAQYPGITHIDGTGRLQTVSDRCPSENSFIYRLLTTFHSLTHSPVLLNTSFNDREPIVETPIDAIRCFLKTEIDFLYFEALELLVSKRIEFK